MNYIHSCVSKRINFGVEEMMLLLVFVFSRKMNYQKWENSKQRAVQQDANVIRKNVHFSHIHFVDVVQPMQ